MKTAELKIGDKVYLFASRAMEWEEQELSELASSIKSVGVQEPVVFTWFDINGSRTKVYLDGRRRLLAANASSLADFEVQVPESEYKGEVTEEAIGRFIDHVNSKAVELGRGARKRTAGVIAKMETFLDKHRPSARARQIEAGAVHGSKGAVHGAKGGRGKKSENPLGAPGRQGGFEEPKKRAPKLSEAVAKEAGTSARTVERTIAVVSKGTPELVAEVQAGRIPAKSAERISKLAEDEQRVIVELVEDGLKIRHAERVAKLDEKARKAVVRMVNGGVSIDHAISSVTQAGPESDFVWIDVIDGSNASIDRARAAITSCVGSLAMNAFVVAFCGAADFNAVRVALSGGLGTHGEVMRTPLIWLRDNARGSSWCEAGEGFEFVAVARVRGCAKRLNSSAIFEGADVDAVAKSIASAWDAKAPRRVTEK